MKNKMLKKFCRMKSLGRNALTYTHTHKHFFSYVTSYFDLPGMKHLVSVHLPIMKYFEMGRHSLCLSETSWCLNAVQKLLSLCFNCKPFSFIKAEIEATAGTDF